MNLEEQTNYIKQLEDENSALKKMLEDRREIDKFDEIAMRKLWLEVVKVNCKVSLNTPTHSMTPSAVDKIAHMVVESYKKEFNIK